MFGITSAAFGILLLAGPAGFHSRVIPLAIARGASDVAGGSCIYYSLATGMMGKVAPIYAASPVVPAAWSIIKGSPPHALTLIGMAGVVVGLVVVTADPVHAGPTDRRSIRVALL